MTWAEAPVIWAAEIYGKIQGKGEFEDMVFFFYGPGPVSPSFVNCRSNSIG